MRYCFYDTHCADDAHLFVPAESGEVVEVLHQCLQAVMNWMSAKKLKQNPKMELLCVPSSHVQKVRRQPG